MSIFKTISPIDNKVYVEQELHTKKDIDEVIKKSICAQKLWQKISLEERKEYLQKFIDILVSQETKICEELTYQIGRPISHSVFEIRGFKQRADYLMQISQQSLKDFYPEKIDGFKRYIKKVPLGTVALLSPWNYPFLTSVNILIPALLAGNSVILKHSSQTPLVALRYKRAFEEANLPANLFLVLFLTHEDSNYLLAHKKIDGVFFTGSVKGGLEVQKSIKNKFIPYGLELGGKDSAYVKADANLEPTVENLVEGVYFNSGQSCCAVERIYVDEKIYDKFVAEFVKLTKKYVLGNPLNKDTSLGPMVKTSASNFVRKQIKEAIQKGAKSLIDESLFPLSKEGTPYLSPHVLVDVNHSMSLMKEESFGPVVGIMKVSSDNEAIKLMNDSKYGLTASIWTQDIKVARDISEEIEVGTVFVNRCDYLDPSLAWTGTKNSGVGVSLSTFVFNSVTRLKSMHFKL